MRELLSGLGCPGLGRGTEKAGLKVAGTGYKAKTGRCSRQEGGAGIAFDQLGFQDHMGKIGLGSADLREEQTHRLAGHFSDGGGVGGERGKNH